MKIKNQTPPLLHHFFIKTKDVSIAIRHKAEVMNAFIVVHKGKEMIVPIVNGDILKAFKVIEKKFNALK